MVFSSGDSLIDDYMAIGIAELIAYMLYVVSIILFIVGIAIETVISVCLSATFLAFTGYTNINML